MNRNKELLKLKAAAICAIICCYAAQVNAAFPWWYNKMLSWHMPAWLINILENPWIALSGIAIFVTITTTVIGFLARKLYLSQKELAELQKRHSHLQAQHTLLKSNHAESQAIIRHLAVFVKPPATKTADSENKSDNE